VKYIPISGLFTNCIIHVSFLCLFSLVYHITQNIFELDFYNSMERVCLIKKSFTKYSAKNISLYLNTGHYCWYFAEGIFPIAYLFVLIV